MANELVLVTGGSGFVGAHCILQLLAAGYRVRTTVRSLHREADVRRMLERGGVDAGERLSFVAADLGSDAGWREAVEGCRYVLHVASPLPAKEPKHEDELVVPAREGALRVLRAARDAGVERVVLTSSFAAIGYGYTEKLRGFTEKDWTRLDGSGLTAYVKSKAVAERAAWDFMEREGGALELSVVNPVAVFGPVLDKDFSASILIVERLMNRGLPGCPDIAFGVVDVRDVADLHLRAMTHPAAKGERFLAVAGETMSFLDVAKTLKSRMGESGKRVPTRRLPDWMLRAVSLFDPAVKLILPELGKRKVASGDKARQVLGWKPRSNEEALIATAKSLVELGLIKR